MFLRWSCWRLALTKYFLPADETWVRSTDERALFAPQFITVVVVQSYQNGMADPRHIGYDISLQ